MWEHACTCTHIYISLLSEYLCFICWNSLRFSFKVFRVERILKLLVWGILICLKIINPSLWLFLFRLTSNSHQVFCLLISKSLLFFKCYFLKYCFLLISHISSYFSCFKHHCYSVYKEFITDIIESPWASTVAVFYVCRQGGLFLPVSAI